MGVTIKPNFPGDYFDFGFRGTMIVATSGPQGYRPLRLLLAHQLYVKDVPRLLAEHPGQTGLVVVPVDDKAWVEVPPVPPARLVAIEAAFDDDRASVAASLRPVAPTTVGRSTSGARTGVPMSHEGTPMKPNPQGPTKADPIRIGGGAIPADVGRLLRDGSFLVEMLLGLPHGIYEGANRYDTDDEHVLHLWHGGRSWDIHLPRRQSGFVELPRSDEPPDEEERKWLDR